MNTHQPHRVNFADCYVLANNRTKTFISSFLNTFLPKRQEVTTLYEVPQGAEHPTISFYAADALINYLEQNPAEMHAIYWLNGEAAPLRGAMCIFTNDGQTILGIYCETRHPDTTLETGYLRQLQAFCNSPYGLIEYEQPAPQNTDAFLQRFNARAQTGAL